MRTLALLVLLLITACGQSRRTDGVTPDEAAALNAAADKVEGVEVK